LIVLKNDRTHYTGLITVEQINKEDVSTIEKWQEDLWLLDAGQKAYYVIDGQQRLTTIIILIKLILDSIDDNETINFTKKEDWIKKFQYREYGHYQSFIFGYEKDNPSDEYFKTKILEQTSSASDKFPETLYTSNLNDAKEYFKKKISKLSRDEIESLFTKVVTRLKFNFYEIDDDLDVFVTFETMNNRGKPLSSLELLKNRFIYLTTLIEEDEEGVFNQAMLRKDINETWKTIYEYLGKNKDKPLDDDDFLRNHWIMYFKYDRKTSGAFAKFLLNKQFNAKNVIDENSDARIGFKEIKEYTDSLRESVKYWYYIYNPLKSDFNDEIQEWLQKFERLGFASFAPLFMATMVKGNNEEILLNLLKVAEKFNFLIFQVTKRPSNTKNSHFYRVAHELYWGVSTIDNVIDNINLLIDGDDKGNYPWFNAEDFQRHIMEKLQKEEGYYSWSGIRYFLYEYELFLQNKAKGTTKISWADFIKRQKEKSIEHIYPQSAKRKCWTLHFSKFSKKERDKLLHSLGNLVLITQSKNSGLLNKCFKDKRKYLDKIGNEVGFYNGSYSEIEVAELGKDNEWTPGKIYHRSMKMLEFLENRWSVTLEDSEGAYSKKDMLNIDFEL